MPSVGLSISYQMFTHQNEAWSENYRILQMSSNRGVVYLNPEKSKFRRSIFQPSAFPAGKEIDRGVILKVVSINICGSDQHMVRNRTTAPAGRCSAMRSPAR